ncbi:hypothetical protein P3M90_004126 [Salmonella enterica]|uniref:Uncharacterized protein n=1 Tax=Salmonella houtenae TaxID=59205 RepID=A0A702LZJ2_SALHO|nr:hypothetical protein [Salmonella enterica]ECC1599415.1 hypothetical protein [Salmonella enterica subsp. houtenae]EDV4890234.1 hypothetical protein [Salmonella enterica subsp. enterica]EEH1861325.1 hypothetical protein [Salmonella enterica subsp. houtenae serovar 50:g,z51:-]HAE7577909.1 hypothetical protein [Salmonella enterica subsp. houtenae serovar 48:g,z51:-]
MTKAETERHLRGIYFEWIRENRDTSEKELSFHGYICHLPNFSAFRFGAARDYQQTAMWVREWNEQLGISS